MCNKIECDTLPIAMIYLNHYYLNNKSEKEISLMIDQLTIINYRVICILSTKMFNYYNILTSSMVKVTKEKYGLVRNILRKYSNIEIYISNCNMVSLSETIRYDYKLLCLPHTAIELSISIRLQNNKIAYYIDDISNVTNMINNFNHFVDDDNIQRFISSFRINGNSERIIRMINNYISTNVTKSHNIEYTPLYNILLLFSLKRSNLDISLFHFILLIVIYKVIENIRTKKASLQYKKKV